ENVNRIKNILVEPMFNEDSVIDSMKLIYELFDEVDELILFFSEIINDDKYVTIVIQNVVQSNATLFQHMRAKLAEIIEKYRNTAIVDDEVIFHDAFKLAPPSITDIS